MALRSHTKGMNQHPPGAHELALRLMRHEAGDVTGPGSTAAALESVWLRLSAALEPLVGRGGADALIARAVSLARREFPFLGAVRPALEKPGSLTELRESVAAQDAAQAEAAAVAVLERLLGLLVGLLGEELGLKPVRAIWPDGMEGVGAAPSQDGEA